MTNMRVEAAYRQAVGAFRNPTLDLLHGRYAPFVVASLSLMFSADRQSVAVADAHIEVQDVADELRASGFDDDARRVPVGTGREICRHWVRVGWLIPQIDDGVEAYRLSAQAVGALEIVGRAGGGQARISRSRVRTLLDSIEQLAMNAEPDPARRIERLRAERAELDAEISRLESGEADPVEEDQLLEEAENVLHLSRELPADFTRVAESIKAMQRDVVVQLRQDVRPAAEVLREYLNRGQHVMEATPEGRAFAGALRLIGDPEQIENLNTQLATLLGLPFSWQLRPEQRRDLEAVAKRVEQGVSEVLTAQRRASHVITAQVRTHDPVRDREVDDLLRGVMSGLQASMQDGSGRDIVEPLRNLPTAGVRHLRQSFSDPRPPVAPEPLHRADGSADFDDNDTRAWGGPHYRELEEYVDALPGDTFDLAAAFEGVDAQSRRPVDLLGLLEIAHRNGMVEGEDISVVEAVRPDGTTRRFAFGTVSARTQKEPASE